MGAAPAYSYYPERAPERIERAPRTRISVVPGQGPRTQSPTLPSSVVFLAKAVAVVLVVVSLVAFARIALSSATVATSVQAQELSSQIDEARSSGASLEVSQSLLTNPTYLKQQAAGLGMAAPAAALSLSAHTGAGLAELEAVVAALFPADQGQAGAVLTNPRQVQAVERAAQAAERARAALEAGLTPDAVLTDAEEAQRALGEVTGRTVREDMVARIFDRFCVGK